MLKEHIKWQLLGFIDILIIINCKKAVSTKKVNALYYAVLNSYKSCVWV